MPNQTKSHRSTRLDPTYERVVALADLDASDSPPPPPPPTPAEIRATHERHAQFLREGSGGAYLMLQGMSVWPDVQSDAYLLYRAKLLQDAGNPSNPLIVMMIEHMMQVHHAIGKFIYMGSTASKADVAATYMTAAARLMAEYRRSTIAIGTPQTGIAKPTSDTVAENTTKQEGQKEETQASPPSRTVAEVIDTPNAAQAFGPSSGRPPRRRFRRPEDRLAGKNPPKSELGTMEPSNEAFDAVKSAPYRGQPKELAAT